MIVICCSVCHGCFANLAILLYDAPLSFIEQMLQENYGTTPDSSGKWPLASMCMCSFKVKHSIV